MSEQGERDNPHHALSMGELSCTMVKMRLSLENLRVVEGLSEGAARDARNGDAPGAKPEQG